MVGRLHSAFRALCLLALLTTGACWAGDDRASASLGYLAPDAASQRMEQARTEAQASGRRILIIAGGDWCRWCHVLDRFLDREPALQSRLDAAFVVVKVEVDGSEAAHPVLDPLPPALGYPHFWVLEANGEVVESIETGGLESGRNSYSRKAFGRFLDRFAPHSP